jgi:hypothetical protein
MKQEPARAGARPALRRLRSLAASGLISSPKLKIKSLLGTPRLRHLAGRIHTLGPGPLAEMLIELSAGEPLMPTLEAYSRLYPLGEVIAAFGSDRLPQPRIVATGGGGR